MSMCSAQATHLSKEQALDLDIDDFLFFVRNIGMSSIAGQAKRIELSPYYRIGPLKSMVYLHLISTSEKQTPSPHPPSFSPSLQAYTWVSEAGEDNDSEQEEHVKTSAVNVLLLLVKEKDDLDRFSSQTSNLDQEDSICMKRARHALESTESASLPGRKSPCSVSILRNRLLSKFLVCLAYMFRDSSTCSSSPVESPPRVYSSTCSNLSALWGPLE